MTKKAETFEVHWFGPLVYTPATIPIGTKRYAVHATRDAEITRPVGLWRFPQILTIAEAR